MFYGMNAWFLATMVLGVHLWVAGVSFPAVRRASPELGAAMFLGTWSRGAPVLTTLTTASIGLGVMASVREPDPKWAIGAGFLALALLISAVLTHPLAGRVREARLPPADLAPLIRRWGHLHLARSAVFAIGVFFFIWAAH